MRLRLQIWRQRSGDEPGRFVTYEMPEVNPDMSFLEMLDVLNERLIGEGEAPVAFDSDCREGICGTCGFMIDGEAHGPRAATTVCQLHMREFRDGDRLTLEPWRAVPLPVVRDLVVDRGAFDRIIAAGGYVSVNTGSPPDANALPVPRPNAERAFEAAACIGCAACVAQCPNGAAQLFTAAKVAHLALLPQGQPERYRRAERMVRQMEQEGFGACSNFRECEAVCPKEISVELIAAMNRDWAKAKRMGRRG
ncbi:MAG TPA: succinate dehydrogenase/fumarate reductase iron-sulfur subunit, partial [Thermoanaerobaculia bacterium]|nr:succinate dehydrogenase/fumarate reductase iron-sulfur subunit [Thermoanaerobaculia bacterium]